MKRPLRSRARAGGPSTGSDADRAGAPRGCAAAGLVGGGSSRSSAPDTRTAPASPLREMAVVLVAVAVVDSDVAVDDMVEAVGDRVVAVGVTVELAVDRVVVMVVVIAVEVRVVAVAVQVFVVAVAVGVPVVAVAVEAGGLVGAAVRRGCSAILGLAAHLPQSTPSHVSIQ
mmetsp:Transcript_109796/g.311346  ORF Transcript_109796/g.311346 Transcript_109796/m.311346 type:complete len:171 (+) Transcript_109796:678-1190(+)